MRTPPLAPPPRPRRQGIRQLGHLSCLFNRSKQIQPARRLGEASRIPVFCLPFFPFTFPSSLLALFLLDEQGPPAGESVASVREHALDHGVGVDAGAAHPMQSLLFEGRGERLRLGHAQNLLLLRRVVGEERVREDVGQTGSENRPLREQRLEQAQRLRGDMIRVIRLLGQDLLSRDIIVIIIKRQLAAEQGIQNYAQAPDIYLLARILLPLQHLRRRVTYRPTKRLQIVRLTLVLPRKPKVTQLDIFVLIQQNILQLQIAMHALLLVDVADCPNELGECFLYFFDRQSSVLQQIVVELVAGAVLQDEPDERLGDDDFVEARDVRVDKLAVVVDFAGEVGVLFSRRLEDDLVVLSATS
mgnify:CR=1 FL=1